MRGLNRVCYFTVWFILLRIVFNNNTSYNHWAKEERSICIIARDYALIKISPWYLGIIRFSRLWQSWRPFAVKIFVGSIVACFAKREKIQRREKTNCSCAVGDAIHEKQAARLDIASGRGDGDGGGDCESVGGERRVDQVMSRGAVIVRWEARFNRQNHRSEIFGRRSYPWSHPREASICESAHPSSAARCVRQRIRNICSDISQVYLLRRTRKYRVVNNVERVSKSKTCLHISEKH